MTPFGRYQYWVRQAQSLEHTRTTGTRAQFDDAVYKAEMAYRKLSRWEKSQILRDVF